MITKKAMAIKTLMMYIFALIVLIVVIALIKYMGVKSNETIDVIGNIFG